MNQNHGCVFSSYSCWVLLIINHCYAASTGKSWDLFHFFGLVVVPGQIPAQIAKGQGDQELQFQATEPRMQTYYILWEPRSKALVFPQRSYWSSYFKYTKGFLSGALDAGRRWVPLCIQGATR